MHQNKKWRPVAGVLLAGCVAASILPGCASHDSAYEAEKVTVCHEGKTLVIPQSALQAHLGHGDSRGSCE